MNDMMKNEVEAIRAQYTQMKPTALEELKALDKKVKRPTNTFAYTFGAVSAVVMGAGMSLMMTNLGEMIGMKNALVPGVIIGAVGMAMALVNYPIYKKKLAARKKEFAPQILALSEKIMHG